MSARLEGKVVLITGAGGGLGSEQARMMAREGAKIVAANLKLDVNIAQGEAADSLWKRNLELVEEINQAGGEAIAVELDVSKEEDWIRAVGIAEDKFGKLNVLSNNAGIYFHASLLDHSTEDLMKIDRVNQLGV